MHFIIDYYMNTKITVGKLYKSDRFSCIGQKLFVQVVVERGLGKTSWNANRVSISGKKRINLNHVHTHN